MKLRAYYVAPMVIVLFMARGERHFIIESDIPEDAEIVGTQWDCTAQCFLVTLYHDSFEPVPEGEPAPIGSSPVVTALRPFKYDDEPKVN